MKHKLKVIWAAALGMAVSGSALAAAPTVTTAEVVDTIESPWDMAFIKVGTMIDTDTSKRS
ncbi:MAG: hypothetical protein ACK57J_08620, partial [Rubrivivax sp.]